MQSDAERHKSSHQSPNVWGGLSWRDLHSKPTNHVMKAIFLIRVIDRETYKSSKFSTKLPNLVNHRQA